VRYYFESLLRIKSNFKFVQVTFGFCSTELRSDHIQQLGVITVTTNTVELRNIIYAQYMLKREKNILAV